MRVVARLAAAVLFLTTLIGPASAAPNVVASIKPVASLVAAVMQGVGTPHLIVAGNGSPHTYALKPSDAAALQQADLVFWIGPVLENFLIDPVTTLASKATSVPLEDVAGLTRLPPRRGGTFEADDDGDQAGPIDPHLWLDPDNAKVMVAAIAVALARADPGNAVAYAANSRTTQAVLDALVAEVETKLAPARGKPFVVFHDAYQYFENRFNVSAIGSIVVEPDVMPGVKRLGEIRDKVQNLAAICVFSEPEFTSSLVESLTEGTSARKAVLDPLGADLDDGPALYVTLIRNLADNLASCLAAAPA